MAWAGLPLGALADQGALLRETARLCLKQAAVRLGRGCGAGPRHPSSCPRAAGSVGPAGEAGGEPVVGGGEVQGRRGFWRATARSRAQACRLPALAGTLPAGRRTRGRGRTPARSAHLVSRVDPTPERRRWMRERAKRVHHVTHARGARLLTGADHHPLKRLGVMRRVPRARPPVTLNKHGGQAGVTPGNMVLCRHSAHGKPGRRPAAAIPGALAHP
jgi:hypothetical protein